MAQAHALLPGAVACRYNHTRDMHAWNVAGAHHVDMVPLADGRWMAAFDGREACDVTRKRKQYVLGRRRQEAAKQKARRQK